ncbi:hypothetical protein ACI65C_009680 [Semiaphis heraclei]
MVNRFIADFIVSGNIEQTIAKITPLKKFLTKYSPSSTLDLFKDPKKFCKAFMYGSRVIYLLLQLIIVLIDVMH